MNTKQFAQKAIENGYKKKGCEGWKWIEENLDKLDHIFQSKDYKEQKGYKYKCMPLLKQDNMTKLEVNAIETVWYLNNERQRKIEKEKYLRDMANQGWQVLTIDKAKELSNNQERVIANLDMQIDWLKIKKEQEYKVWLDKRNESVYLMRPRQRVKGICINRYLYPKSRDRVFYKKVEK